MGAGTGEMSRELMKSHHVVATDISPGMVIEIKKKLGIEAIVCDAERLPFPDGSFDTVLGAEMIYYLNNPESFLTEAYRVLRPGGRLLLSSANNTTKIYDRIRALFRKFGLGHMYFDDKIREFMTLSRLKEIIESANFKISDERKIIPLPFAFLDSINRILERTPFKHFGIFILVHAEKL